MSIAEIIKSLEEIRHNALSVGKGTTLLYRIDDLLKRLKTVAGEVCEECGYQMVYPGCGCKVCPSCGEHVSVGRKP